jgi:hypothetical protein
MILYMLRNDELNRLQRTKFCMTLQRNKSFCCYGFNDTTEDHFITKTLHFL